MARLLHTALGTANAQVFGGSRAYTLGSGNVYAFYSNHTFSMQMHVFAGRIHTSHISSIYRRIVVNYGGEQHGANIYAKNSGNTGVPVGSYLNSGGDPVYHVALSCAGTETPGTMAYTARGMFYSAGINYL